MKRFFKAMRFLAIYIVALVSFTTLAYASTRVVNFNYFGPYAMGFNCINCGADDWLVAFDLQGYPFHAHCSNCMQECVLDGNGDPVMWINL